MLTSWRAALGALAVLASSMGHAGAAGFPDKPIKFIVGFGAGGTTDLVARVLAERMSRDLAQSVIVEDDPGGSGNLATRAAAAAAADGYTYLVGANPLAVNEAMSPEFPIKFGKDLTAVAAVGSTANVLVVRSALNIHTLAAFVQRARAKPGGMTYGTLGVGSESYLAGVAFELRADCKMLAVPYRGGGDALQDLLGGSVDARFASIPAVLGAVRDGSVIALATTGPIRSPWLPDVPTIAESGYPGYDVRLWVGLFAPSGAPVEALQAIEQAVGRAMAAGDTRQALERQGIAPLSMSRVEFSDFVSAEIARAKTLVASFKADER